MCFRIWTVLGLMLVLAACSNGNGGKEPRDGGPGKNDAGAEDATTADDGAANASEDAAVPSRLSRPALERPPTRGLPDSLKPPR